MILLVNNASKPQVFFFFSRPVTHTTVNLADRKFGVNWGAGVNWLGSRKQGAPG